jgi:hypothetical protein
LYAAPKAAASRRTPFPGDHAQNVTSINTVATFRE